MQNSFVPRYFDDIFATFTVLFTFVNYQAIRDGVIDGEIDHENACLMSKVRHILESTQLFSIGHNFPFQ